MFLNKEYRITQAYDFRRVRRLGNLIKTPHFLLNIAKGKGNTSRLGIVISNKFDKRATIRNKYKRMVRRVMKNTLDNSDIPYDIVFIAKKELKGISYERLSDLVNKALSNSPFARKRNS